MREWKLNYPGNLIETPVFYHYTQVSIICGELRDHSLNIQLNMMEFFRSLLKLPLHTVSIGSRFAFCIEAESLRNLMAMTHILLFGW